MRVLVTGGRGQVGRALAACAPGGVTVLAPGRDELDLGRRESVEGWLQANRPDAIINAGAYTAVDKAESEAELAATVNGEAPGWMARWARGACARMVQVSTDYVFDGRGPLPYPPGAATGPLGVYGASKLAGEAAAEGAVIVRTAWVYASDGSNFVRTMLRLMRERPEVRVVADQVGAPTHAASLGGALWRLLDVGPGVWHWTDAGAASWYDFAVAIQEEAAALGLLKPGARVVPIMTADYPTPARRPAYSLLDCRAAWAVTGVPRHWRAELRDALRAIA